MVHPKMSFCGVRWRSTNLERSWGTAMKLTQVRIEGLKCPPEKRDVLVFDDEQRGLGVRITASGGKTFLAQYAFHGQKRRIPLGSTSGVSLAKARDAVRAILGDVARGIDPAAERKKAAAEARQKAAHEALTCESAQSFDPQSARGQEDLCCCCLLFLLTPTPIWGHPTRPIHTRRGAQHVCRAWHCIRDSRVAQRTHGSSETGGPAGEDRKANDLRRPRRGAHCIHKRQRF